MSRPHPPVEAAARLVSESDRQVGEYTESRYRRPEATSPRFLDDNGRPVEYGNRWQGSPPDGSYSVISHPERFEPVQAVADALISHLTAAYATEVTEGTSLLPSVGERQFSPVPAEKVKRVVRLAPPDEDCSPLTFISTAFPGIQLLAGDFASFTYPDCGCDACDDTWERCAEALEEDGFAIVSGGFKETVNLDPRRRPSYSRGSGLEIGMGRSYGWSMRGPDGAFERSSTTDAGEVPIQALRAVHRRLVELKKATPDGAWKAWPERRHSTGRFVAE